MTERREIRVTGKVQGVFFRASAKEQAESLGLSGFVRNEADGSVVVVVEGELEQLDTFVMWCWEGPRDAAVARVDVQGERPEGLRGFEVRS